MPRFLPDTNCLIASVSGGHQHHPAATAELQRRLDMGHRMVVAGHTLAEAYSVMTRRPPPDRVTPTQAVELLRASIVEQSELTALAGPQYLAFLQEASERGIAGGRTYDALIAASAVAANVDVFLTFNERHFRALLPDAVEVIVPSE